MSTADVVGGSAQAAAGPRVRAGLGRRLRIPIAVVRVLRATWTAALLGFVIAALGACAIGGSSLFLGAGSTVDRLLGGGVAGITFLAAWGMVRGVRWLLGLAVGRLVPQPSNRLVVDLGRWLTHPRRSAGIALALGLWVLALLNVPGLAAFAPSNAYLPAILVAAVVGGLVGLARAAWPHATAGPRERPVRLAAAWLVAMTAFALTAGSLTWAALPGPGPGSLPPPPAVATIDAGLEDPGLPGPYAVKATSYGSGLDPHRPAFGPETPIRTGTVDASKAVDPIPFPGDAYARWLLGSGLDQLPLNALVWYPDGPGPFPLVLVVHGNHAMGDFSEAGYAYLGEHLASRGFITASVDEAMLNGNLFGDLHGAEMAVRAWVLLQHLDLWRGWTADPASPFHGLVDLSRVALIGHSRGGEAAAVAASMASADPSSYPELQPFPTGLAIKAVVGIAPCDGQIEGAGHGANRLEGVDYLTIQGGADADMAWWSSIRQLARTDVAGTDDFKAGIWIRRANHGRFSSIWNLGDAGVQGEWLLDQASLLAPDEQQDVARTVIAGFLEASLHGRDGYRAVFRVPAAGLDWLPSDAYVTRLVEGSTTMLADFDPASTGGGLTAEGSTRVFRQDLATRGDGVTQDNRVARVAWPDGGGAVHVDVPGAAAATLAQPRATVRFALATAAVDPSAPLPDVRVELVDAAGRVAASRLSAVGGVMPPMPVNPWKSREVAGLAMLGQGVSADAEAHLQTFVLPVASFNGAADFDRSSVRMLRFAIGAPASGALFLDEIGVDAE